jgi:hypothetical protein
MVNRCSNPARAHFRVSGHEVDILVANRARKLKFCTLNGWIRISAQLGKEQEYIWWSYGILVVVALSWLQGVDV